MRPTERPNILWIQTDEQRPDSLSCYGSPWAKTPNIERLASRGTVMFNAVCNSPVCVPSRSSQFASRYPQEFACLNNDFLLGGKGYPDGYTTFPQVLREAGYETVSFGRYHCVSDAVFERVERTQDFLPEYTGHFGLNPAYSEEVHHVLKRPNAERTLIIAGTYPGPTNPNRITSERAMEFLSSRHPSDRPFLLRVSFNQPHTPVLAPPPFDSLYDPAELPVRYFDREAYLTRSGYDRTYADAHRMDLLTSAQIEQVWKDYMGLCAYVDYETGRVLDALESAELLDDTIILYSADHGKSLGEWGAGEKDTFDREVWRVPFVWCRPGAVPEGRIEENPCELIDTGPTVLSLCGLADRIPDSWVGRSLFEDVAGGRGTKAPERAVFGAIRMCLSDCPTIDHMLMRVAVRTARYRMDVYWGMDGVRPGDSRLDGNLFDLERDPGETRNLFDNPDYSDIRSRHMAILAEWLERHPPDPRLADPANLGRMF